MKNNNIELKRQAKSGEIYYSNDPNLVHEQLHYLEDVRKFNNTHCSIFGLKKRERMAKKMFAEYGEGNYIETPLHSNFGCKNVHFGSHIYCNFNLTLVDDNDIFIGDCTMIAPNVTIATAAHPICPELRDIYGLQYNLPVKIGRNCWIGAGAIILPGITIGDNTVIGAGSVVTKDIPANVVAVGDPCRVLRPITNRDRDYYNHDIKIPTKIKEQFLKNK